MEFNLPEIRKVVDTKAAYDAAVKAVVDNGKTVIATAAKQLFDKYPQLACLTWVQYTPHFNDGEPCVFGLHELHLQTIQPGDAETLPYGDPNEDDSTWDIWDLEEVPWDKAKRGEYGDDLASFQDLLNDLEDACEQIFGDGVQIILRRDGVQVLDHEHD